MDKKIIGKNASETLRLKCIEILTSAHTFKIQFYNILRFNVFLSFKFILNVTHGEKLLYRYPDLCIFGL